MSIIDKFRIVNKHLQIFEHKVTDWSDKCQIFQNQEQLTGWKRLYQDLLTNKH